MANRFFGEVAIDTDDGPVTLRCDLNAMIEFEDASEMNALEAFEAIETGNGGGDLRMLRLMVWAMMRHHHPEATVGDAGVVLSCDIEAPAKAIAAASPAADEVPPGNPKPRKKASAR
ncbi:hypothetical protein [Palleronia sp. LCG004]|uniref:hypothetical protein n=1 Tax=Palleronia sp. LCG004 TaxID=3079304 RepID=UPI00294315FC|nr:hypothetical protein [Palleronia sp. LCG004]WOI54957.1 hypothetical protein RVY76_07720 [Palleronia sp. LCG004]